MIIVNDIQDASTMQKALNSFVRRSNNFNYSKEHMLVELDMIITDLQKNVDRIDLEMSTEAGESTCF
mgnify:CR=1 FL=1|tara:strand:- start:39 stop:239 length:201 start_codon:yes stop_codon:yes gene_type:complete